jgi:SPP1 gp7 family putative phage head morphogenesis protein
MNQFDTTLKDLRAAERESFQLRVQNAFLEKELRKSKPAAATTPKIEPVPPPIIPVPGARLARPVRANLGLRFLYQRSMLALIEEMSAHIEGWAAAQYVETPPLVAADALPSVEIRKRFQEIAKRWLRRFDRQAPKIAEAYLEGQFKATDSAMRAALREAGISVRMEITPAMRDALAASLSENVALIKTIPQKYLQQVEGVILRAYANGQNLKQMIARIQKIYPKTRERAVLIARDQSNKANAVVVRARQMELGITEALWIHSHGGKVPRPDHLAANGRRYKIADGCLISGEYIQPGEKINCRCVSRSVLPDLQSA